MVGTGSFNANDHQIKIESPKGEAVWASLAKPKRWNDGDTGSYQISLIVEKHEAEDIINKGIILRDNLAQELEDTGGNIKLSPHHPWKETDDGKVEFRFKKPHFEANDKYPASTPVATYLADGSRVDWNEVDWGVGNGSIVKVGGFIRPYYVAAAGGLGVTLRLAAVKVFNLEKYRSGGEDSFGFGNEAEAPETSDEATVDADF
jgi:hypothetical protein